MDETRTISKIEVKIDFINGTHLKEVQYWKKIALENKNEEERKQLVDLAPIRVFFWLVRML